ncbi:unnamed protein product, partial [Choristocarpus tenellus]
RLSPNKPRSAECREPPPNTVPRLPRCTITLTGEYTPPEKEHATFFDVDPEAGTQDMDLEAGIAMIVLAQDKDPLTQPLESPGVVPLSVEVAWEDDGTLQWELRLSEEEHVEGFVSKVCKGFVKGAQPQSRQLVMIEPLSEYNMELGNAVGVARGVQWWNPGTPIYCKLVN